MHDIWLELRRVFSTRGWLYQLLALLAFVAIFPAVIAVTITSSFPADEILPQTILSYLYSFVGRAAYFAPFLFGVLLVTSEFHNNTIARSIFFSRSRASLYMSKIVAVFAISILYAVLSTAVSATTVSSALALQGFDSQVFEWANVSIGVRTVFAFAIWGVLGVGLGALLRSQIVSIVTVFMFTLFIEPMLTSLSNENEVLRSVGRYLPGAANWSAVWPPEDAGVNPFESAASSLGWETGLLILLAYSLVFAVIGYLIGLRRRDLA
ncbi:hypothetical protein [Cryobacterium sp. Y57]|uniref:hypothetical protein n=1 Tax=Cryobacterium sp. Y57 TaxID=2048287 RepID=UPI000CE47ADB|nr:hypothetical protein [Cryobacterium sp. Y57]